MEIRERLEKAEKLLKKIKDLEDHLSKVQSYGLVSISYGGSGFDPDGDSDEVYLSKDYINYEEFINDYKAEVKKDIDKCKLEFEKL